MLPAALSQLTFICLARIWCTAGPSPCESADPVPAPHHCLLVQGIAALPPHTVVWVASSTSVHAVAAPHPLQPAQAPVPHPLLLSPVPPHQLAPAPHPLQLLVALAVCLTTSARHSLRQSSCTETTLHVSPLCTAAALLLSRWSSSLVAKSASPSVHSFS